MATLRDCFFAYNHELAGASLDEEAKIVTVKRVDLDYTFRVCDTCAKGMLETGNFVLVPPEEEETGVEEISNKGVVEEVSLNELLERTVEENADTGEGNT